LWTTANEHAKVAAQSLLNGPQEIKNQPTYFWTEQFDLAPASPSAPYAALTN
jgi:hypothetical protein